MFAVIRTGGKQYRVAKDDTIVVERLTGDPGAMIELSDVLMIGGAGKAPRIGRPAVDKAAVFAEVVEQSRGDKILVFKKRRRKNHRRTRGHRQDLTVLRILDVSPTGTRPKAAEKPAAKKDDKVSEKAKKAESKSKPAAKKEAKTDSEVAPKPKKKAPAKKAETKSKDAKAAPKKKAPVKSKAKAQSNPTGDAAKKKAAPKKKAPAKGKTTE